MSLQAVILRAARGVNPDTFWLGRISAQSFMQVIRDLIALLTIGNTEKARCLQSDLQEMHSSVTLLSRKVSSTPLSSLSITRLV